MTTSTSKQTNDLLSIWAHLPGLHWVVDIKYKLVGISEDYLKLLGKTKEEVLQKDIFNVFQHSRNAQLIGNIFLLKETIQKVRTTGNEIRYSLQEKTSILSAEPSTSHNPLDLLYIPIINEQKKVIYIIHQAKEIPNPNEDQKIKEISQSHEAYRTIAANLPNGAIFIVDRKLKYMLAEGEVLWENNMQSSDLEGKTIDEALDADLAQKLNLYYQQALAGKPFRFEHQRQSRYYVTHGTPLRNERDDIYAALAVSYEITESKRAEKNLTFLAEISNDLVRLTSVNEIMQIVGAKIGKYLNLSFCTFAEVDEVANSAVITYDWHLDEKPSLIDTYPLAEYLSTEFHKTLKAGETFVVHDIDNDARTNAEKYAALNIGAFVCVPLIRNGQWKFLFNVYHSIPYNWRNDELELIQELTTRIWTRLERVYAEEALRKSEKKYQTLYNSIDEGFCIIEVLFDKNDKPIDYRFLQVNLAFEKITGLYDVVGKRIREFLPNLEEYWFETYGKIALSGTPIRFINEATRLTSGWYNVYAFRYGKPESRQVAILFTDITEQKKAEEAIRQSEQHMSALFAQAAAGISEISVDGRFIRVNDELCRMIGKSREELLQLSVPDITHPDDISKSISALQGIIKTGEPASLDKRYLKADGTYIWANSILNRLDDTHGNPQSLLAITVDLTERRQAQESLRQNEERLQLIIETARDYAIFTMDNLGNITNWNKGAQHLTGYTEQEAKGKSVHLIFTPEDKKNKVPEEKLQKALEQGRIEDERWHVRKDGTQFYSMGVLMALYDKDHKILGFLKIMRDHTERIKMEEALKKAKEEAEKAARAKEQFLAHMSHEIRTPLNIVIGLSDLLLQKKPREDQLGNLQTLKFSAENLRMLVNDILDFSKIQAGKVTLEEKNVDLRALLENLQKAHQQHAIRQKNKLLFKIDEDVPDIVCTDELKLSQVLQNLINNAIKFTTNGVVKIEVSLNRKDKDIFWLDFSVRDTGIGIPQEKLASIFDIFTQADNSTEREYGGTGLGLSICKWLVELLGSQIEVESQKGQGSRFFFTLPMKIGKESNFILTKHKEEAAELSHIRILLVEDTDINRQLLKQFITYWWKVIPDEACNGEEALKKAQAKQYDLILMDIRMPVMDGYKATKIIRNLPNSTYHQIPIIALTADTLNEVEKHPEAELFTDVITKPFNYDDLQQKLVQHAKV